MSQFIEMFGIAESTKPLADFIDVSFPGEWGQEDKDGSGVKVIRTTNFTNNGKLDLSDVVTRDIDYAKVEKKKLSKGDIILERSGGTNDNPVGRVVYFEEDGIYLFNNFTQLLRCKEGINSLFIFYSLFNYYQMNKNVIRSMGNKTTGIQNLKMDRYWQIPIADISTERQKEFESIFRQADKSGFDGFKSQFIEMFGTSDANEKGWPISSFGKKLTITSGGTPDTQNESYWNGNISWIGSNLCQNCILKENDGKYITEEGLEHSSAKIYKPDTVLVALVGATIGKVAYLAFETSTNQNVAGIVVNDNKEFEPMFIYYLLQNMYNRFFMLGMGKFKMASLGFIKALPLMMPPLALQKQFVSITQQADKSGFELRKSIEAIDKVIKSLVNVNL